MDLRSIAYPAFWRPLMYLLQRLGVEFDQRMGQAWEMCSSQFVTEVQLLTALVKLGARGLECLPDNWLSRACSLGEFPPSVNLCPPEDAEIAAHNTFPVWIRALELAGTSKVLTCQNFCQGLSDSLLSPWDGPVADGALVPDFILTNPEIQQAMILDLKLPKPKLVRHQDNRVRFAGAVMEARAQLLEYRDWFENKGHRERLVGRLGMEVFRPRLGVIIGRSSDFRCALDRQKLNSLTPDVEVLTYDDVLAFAKRRLLNMGRLEQRLP